MCRKWEFWLVSIYKDRNGKFWLRNLDLPICVTGCHTDGLGRGEGGYGWLWRCSHKDSYFSTACTAVLVIDDDDDDGAVRTYNCGMPHCRWMMEELQWLFISLVDEWVMRTYSGLTPRSLLGGGWGHHQLCLLHGPQCGTSFISLWWLCWCHPGTLYPTVAWTAAWPRPQTWCKLPWPCHHWRTCTWGTAKQLQLEAGWVCTVVPVQEMLLGGVGPSPAGTVSLLQLSLGEDLALDSDNALGCWSESLV